MDTRELLELEAGKLRSKLESLGRKRLRLDANIAEIEKKLEAISVVVGQVLNLDPDTDSHGNHSTKPSRADSSSPTLTDIVKESLRTVEPGIIKMPRLLEIGQSLDPENVNRRNMTKTLARLMSDAGGEVIKLDKCHIVLRETGKGARPSVYEKISTEMSNGEFVKKPVDQGRFHDVDGFKVAAVQPHWRVPPAEVSK